MAELLIDPLGGASGDMFLSGFIGLGVDASEIEGELADLIPNESFKLEAQETVNRGFSGWQLKVLLKEGKNWVSPESVGHSHTHDDKPKGGPSHAHGHSHSHQHRSFNDIRGLIESSKLDDAVIKNSIRIFKNLAVAEGLVHAKPYEEVHFHEVGAVDSIVDIVGSCLAFHLLGIQKAYSSPVGVASSGYVQCAHGMLPLPAPATLELLKGVRLIQTGEEKELCTPTGAALLTGFAEFKAVPSSFKILKSSRGLSHRTPKKAPPFLRLSLIEMEKNELESPTNWIREELMWISANIDDMNPEYVPLLSERLFAEGALDVSAVHLLMKKGRMGLEVRVLCSPELEVKLSEILFEHSTTLGVRKEMVKRDSLPRESKIVKTPWGEVSVKSSTLSSGRKKIHAEYEDVASICKKSGVSWSEVIAQVQKLAEEKS